MLTETIEAAVKHEADVVVAVFKAAQEMPGFCSQLWVHNPNLVVVTMSQPRKRKSSKRNRRFVYRHRPAVVAFDEIDEARSAVDAPFSVMESHLPSGLSHEDLLQHGITIQWAPGVTHLAAQVAVYELVHDFMMRGPQAVRDFRQQHRDNPYANGSLPKPGAAVQKQHELEARYFGQPA